MNWTSAFPLFLEVMIAHGMRCCQVNLGEELVDGFIDVLTQGTILALVLFFMTEKEFLEVVFEESVEGCSSGTSGSVCYYRS